MISVVVPVHDEEGSLEELSRQIAAVGTVDGHAIEVIFVDDGSRDDSWNVIEQLSQTHGVTGVRLRRNFGKAAALMAGIGHAKGDFIITMDADLQDDPAEIPQLYQVLQAGGPIGKKGRVNLDAEYTRTGPGRHRLAKGPGGAVRHYQWLEKRPPRSMAQGISEQGLQWHGELADGRSSPRSQLRAQNLPRRSIPRGSFIWRTAPFCPGFGRCQRIPHGGNGGKTSPPHIG